jgi:hypothetical protein
VTIEVTGRDPAQVGDDERTRAAAVAPAQAVRDTRARSAAQRW